MIELDRQLFQLCKPEGVFRQDDDTFVEEEGRRHGYWSPSTYWSDMEPLIVAAANAAKLDFDSKYIVEKGWPDHWECGFDLLSDNPVGLTYGPTLCEAAARALISLLTAKAGKG